MRLAISLRIRPGAVRVSGRRRGFSLMEVILATAILMGSVVVLARLVGMGRTQANNAELQSDAQRLCETTMHEIVLGLRPIEPIEDAPLQSVQAAATQLPVERTNSNLLNRTSQESVSEANPKWSYSVRTGPVPNVPELTRLTVEVFQSDLTLPRPVRFQLSRWVRPGGTTSSDSVTGWGGGIGGPR